MKNMRRLANSVTLCTGMLLLAGAPAWAQKEELWLETQSATPIRGTAALKRGTPYLLTMKGTYNTWKTLDKTGSKSGKPEPTPMFPSPKGANKLVGIDPEFVFAWPTDSSLDKGSQPSPVRASSIQVSLDGGKTWKHPSSTAPFNATDHAYNYELAGDDNALQVRFVDSPYSDNYGRVQISVQPAEELWLDSRSGAPIRSELVLEKGKPYRFTMQGTFSAWGGFTTVGANSGKPDPSPMFPSPNRANQQVGIDPEFVFAWPKGSGLERSSEPSPRRNTGSIEISLDGGKTWKHPSSTAPFNATDHKYTYEVSGDGNALQVRFLDKPYGDNSGRVRIFLLPGA
ncbi:hypothetical protein F0U63_33185 [Cystobacter fuscus]|nr:hypothetical protein F0U63_33185 [Cystobacter fuscus]